jgi:chlorobactene glucosyltransferase
VTLALALTPWILFFGYVAFRVRLPRPLPRPAARIHEIRPDLEWPAVSVIVPARNEAHNVAACVGSLGASTYPDFEILVVDDRSTDGTGGIARGLRPSHAERYRVIHGEELPSGWFGKPWACLQGARAAEGTLLLFTDADTVHAPDLLERAVLGLYEDRAGALTVAGRQAMESFWEKLLQPQFFVLLVLRFPNLLRPTPRRRWRSAIANGQYILITREVYEGLSGHQAVAGEVVEDMRLAQELVRSGTRLTVRAAEDGLETRMYQTLPDIVEGWGKNLYTASKQTVPDWLRPVIAPLSMLVGALLWLVPPLVLAVVGLQTMVSGSDPSAVLVWAAFASGAGLMFWTLTALRMGISPFYGALYPLGAGLAGLIYVRSWVRGSRIRWKDRDYRIESSGGQE